MARADEPGAVNGAEPLRIWYRSSDGCPDGARFVGRLARFGRRALLADVGDRVDFVVSLAHAPERSRGRLERQTQERTVAVREVESATCDEVADALALSLELTLQPDRAPADSASGSVSAGSVSANPASADSAAALGPVGNTATSDGWGVRVGAQARFETGLADAALPGGALFAELAPMASGPSARLSLRAAHTVRQLDVSLKLTLVSARPEGCMLWGSAALRVGPCAGVDVGMVFAEMSGTNGVSDDGVWTSAVGLVRGHWQIGRALSLEAQIGALVPFVRYRFNTSSGNELINSAAAGVEFALGASFLL
jgi:hypothetical protein